MGHVPLQQIPDDVRTPPPDHFFRDVPSSHDIITANKPSETFLGNYLCTSDLQSAMSWPSQHQMEKAAMRMHPVAISSSLATAQTRPLPPSSYTKRTSLLHPPLTPTHTSQITKLSHLEQCPHP